MLHVSFEKQAECKKGMVVGASEVFHACYNLLIMFVSVVACKYIGGEEHLLEAAVYFFTKQGLEQIIHHSISHDPSTPWYIVASVSYASLFGPSFDRPLIESCGQSFRSNESKSAGGELARKRKCILLA